MREKDEWFWNKELKYLYWMDKFYNMRECWMNSMLPLIVYANYTQYRSSGGGRKRRKINILYGKKFAVSRKIWAK